MAHIPDSTAPARGREWWRKKRYIIPIAAMRGLFIIVLAAAAVGPAPVETATETATETVTEVVTETVTETSTEGAAEAAELASERSRLNRVKSNLNELKAELAAREEDLDDRERELAAQEAEADQQPIVSAPDDPETAYYENCDAAAAAGAAPVMAGDPGYGPHLDGDGDGVGCESG